MPRLWRVHPSHVQKTTGRWRSADHSRHCQEKIPRACDKFPQLWPSRERSRGSRLRSKGGWRAGDWRKDRTLFWLRPEPWRHSQALPKRPLMRSAPGRDWDPRLRHSPADRARAESRIPAILRVLRSTGARHRSWTAARHEQKTTLPQVLPRYRVLCVGARQCARPDPAAQPRCPARLPTPAFRRRWHLADASPAEVVRRSQRRTRGQ